MEDPLVSVICLCYNQGDYVLEALASVVSQDYPKLEVIIVDDGSDDNSVQMILSFLDRYPDILFLNLGKNLGNTTAFNLALKEAKGKYLVDLACDDIMQPGKIREQVCFFENQKQEVGVIYSDALYVTESGQIIGNHFKINRLPAVSGEIYEKLIDTYFIPPPTMMFRRIVMDELGGYDETLAYEDFDFWIRSSRNWRYAYQNKVLMKIRKVSGSHSSNLYKKGNLQLRSTVMVCRKILDLNQNKDENLALARRLKYEIRHAFLMGAKAELNQFYSILEEISEDSIKYKVLRFFNFGMNLNFIRTLIHWVKY